MRLGQVFKPGAREPEGAVARAALGRAQRAGAPSNPP